MEEAGQKLKQQRESLKLRYRDVQQASRVLAQRHGNSEYYVALSRLSDIENHGTTPSIYRIYSLCAIYRLDLTTVLGWYEITPEKLLADSLSIPLPETHLIGIEGDDAGMVNVPLTSTAPDFEKTILVSRLVRQWGKMPLQLLASLDLKPYRFGLIGSQDWSMYPLIPPGSLVQIDPLKRKVVSSGWAQEHERPIYFLEHHGWFSFGWCTVSDKRIIVQSHPSSETPAKVFQFPGEIDVVGQIIGVAMHLDLGKKPHTRS